MASDSEIKNDWLKLGVTTCENCQFKTSDVGVFQTHICRKRIVIRYKKQQATFVCDVCKVEQEEFEFTEHLQCHIHERPYQCSFCSEEFEQKIGIYRHFRKQHSLSNEIYCIKKEGNTKVYLERAKVRGYAFVHVKRGGNVTEMSDFSGVSRMESTVSPSSSPSMNSKKNLSTVSSHHLKEMSSKERDLPREEEHESNMMGIALQPCDTTVEATEENIVKNESTLNPTPCIEMASYSKGNDFFYLNLMNQNDDIIFVCFKCRIKFRDQILFHRHIWKVHIHTSSTEFSCCSFDFDFNCHRFQTALKILEERFSKFFYAHSKEKNKDVSFKLHISKEKENRLAKTHGYTSPIQTKNSASIGSPECIRQLHLKVQLIEDGEKELPCNIVPSEKSENLSPNIQENFEVKLENSETQFMFKNIQTDFKLNSMGGGSDKLLEIGGVLCKSNENEKVSRAANGQACSHYSETEALDNQIFDNFAKNSNTSCMVENNHSSEAAQLKPLEKDSDSYSFNISSKANGLPESCSSALLTVLTSTEMCATVGRLGERNLDKEKVGNLFERNKRKENYILKDTASENMVRITQIHPVESEKPNVGIDEHLGISNSHITSHADQECQMGERLAQRESVTFSEQVNVLSGFYKCSFLNCDFSCYRPADFLTHLQNAHGMENYFTCTYCGFKGQNTSALLDHMDNHLSSSNQYYSVSLSDNSLLVENVENTNLNILLNDITKKSKLIQNVGFKCNVCEEKFLSCEGLTSHLQNSTLKTYSCKHCRSHFLNKKSSEIHIRQEHPGMPRFLRQFVYILCKDQAENKESYPKILKTKVYAWNLFFRKNTSMPEVAESQTELCNSNMDQTPYSLKAKLIPVTRMINPKPSSLQIPLGNCSPSSEETSSCQTAKQVRINDDDNISSLRGLSNSGSFQVVSSDPSQQNKIREVRPTTNKEDNSKSPGYLNSEQEKFEFGDPGLSLSASCSSYETETLMEKETTPEEDIQSQENTQGELSKKSKLYRIFDLCSKSKTAAYLNPLFEIKDNNYLCRACTRIFPKLRPMLCHIFFCQGKISVVNCPFNCSFESEHPKIVAQHILKDHPDKDPVCKSFRQINAYTLYRALKSQRVTQGIFEQACLPFAGKNDRLFTLHYDHRQDAKTDSCYDIISNQTFIKTKAMHCLNENCTKTSLSDQPKHIKAHFGQKRKSVTCESDPKSRSSKSKRIEISETDTSSPGKRALVLLELQDQRDTPQLNKELCRKHRNLKETDVSAAKTEKPDDKHNLHKNPIDASSSGKTSKYQCKLCQIILAHDPYIMKKHIHDIHKLVVCGYCNSPYSNLTILKNHIRFAHNKSKPKFQQIALEMVFSPIDSKTEKTATRSRKKTLQGNRDQDTTLRDLNIKCITPTIIFSNSSEKHGTTPPMQHNFDNGLSGEQRTGGKQQATTKKGSDTILKKRKLDNSGNNSLSECLDERACMLKVVRAIELNRQNIEKLWSRTYESKDGKDLKADIINRFKDNGKTKKHNIIDTIRASFQSHSLLLASAITTSVSLLREGGIFSVSSDSESCENFSDDVNEIMCDTWTEDFYSPTSSCNRNKTQYFSGGCPDPLKRLCDFAMRSGKDRIDKKLCSSGKESISPNIYSDLSSVKDDKEIGLDMVTSTFSPKNLPILKECHEDSVQTLSIFNRDLTASITSSSNHVVPLQQWLPIQKCVNNGGASLKRPFTCGFCKVCLPTISHIKDHCKYEHPHASVSWTDRRTGCDYSDEGKKLYENADFHLSVALYLCGYCDSAAQTREVISKHMEHVHGNMEFHYCLPAFSHKSVVYTEKCNTGGEKHTNICPHEAVLMPERVQNATQLQYYCYICEDILSSEFLFRLHLAKHEGFKHATLVHTTRGLLLCPTCGYVANSSNDLANHFSRHMRERRYRCSACDFDDHQRKGVYVHIRKMHSESNTVHVIDTKEQNKDIVIRPKLVNLQPQVILSRVDASLGL